MSLYIGLQLKKKKKINSVTKSSVQKKKNHHQLSQAFCYVGYSEILKNI